MWGPMVDSPCVKVCELNAEKVCVGCGRDVSEIARWNSLSDAQKESVVEAARRRLGVLAQAEPARR
jgi:uncharacterized protein